MRLPIYLKYSYCISSSLFVLHLCLFPALINLVLYIFIRTCLIYFSPPVCLAVRIRALGISNLTVEIPYGPGERCQSRDEAEEQAAFLVTKHKIVS